MVYVYAVGLGGAGSKVMIELSKKINQLKKIVGEDNVKIKVQIFDMAREAEVIDAVENGILTPDSVKIIPSYAVDSARVMMHLRAKEKSDWFPETLIPEIDIRIRGGQGVERRRPLARLALHTDEIGKHVYNELESDLKDLATYGEDILVIIVTALGGGFGSGTFIDVAAMIRNIAIQHQIKGLKIFGIFMLPHGYGSFPPIGVRVDFEEENAMAALTELYLLQELERRGKVYAEHAIPSVEKFIYTGAYDAYFLVSYGGVPGGQYQEKFRHIDEAIADFIIYLSLTPFRREEAKEKSTFTISGIAINENILEPYKSMLDMLGFGPHKFKPIVMSFNVGSYSLGLEDLLKYYKARQDYDTIKTSYEKLRRERGRINDEIEEKSQELAEAEAEFKRCKERIRRTIESTEVELSEAVRTRIDNRFQADPTNIDSLVAVLNAIPDKLLRLIACRYLEQKFQDEISRTLAKMRRIESQIKELKSELTRLSREYSSLPRYKRIFGAGKDIKKRMEELRHRIEELLAQKRSIEEYKDSLDEALDKLYEYMSNLQKSIDETELCKEYVERINTLNEELRKLEEQLKNIERSIREHRTLLENARRVVEELNENQQVKRLRKLLGSKIIDEELYKRWLENPEEVEKMSIVDIIRLGGKKVEDSIKEDINRKISDLDRPMMTVQKKLFMYAGCVKELMDMLPHADQESRMGLALKGVKIAIVSPRDRDLISLLGRSDMMAQELNIVEREIKFLSIFPIVPFPCTPEYKDFVEQYFGAKYYLPSVYRMIHAFPVKKMLKELGLESVEQLYSYKPSA